MLKNKSKDNSKTDRRTKLQKNNMDRIENTTKDSNTDRKTNNISSTNLEEALKTLKKLQQETDKNSKVVNNFFVGNTIHNISF